MKKTAKIKITLALILPGLLLMPVRGQNTDINILRNINVNRQISFQPAFLLVSNSVYPLSVATPLTFILAGKISGNRAMFRDGLTAGASLIVNESVTTILKYTVNRQRPYQRYHDIMPQSYDTDPSFPSGHTSSAFCTATSLSLMYPKWYVIAPSYAWATAVGYSRLYLGMHYPSDVVAGALIGAGSALITFKLRKWIEKHYAPKKVNDQASLY